jgi:TonB family protein
MATFYSALLVGLGLLPASLWAQQAAPQLPKSSAKQPQNVGLATHADSVAHYQPAVYPGGEAQTLRDLQQRVRYSAAALRAGVEGRVVVAFAIEADGSVGEVRIVKSPSPLLNDEVVWAVKNLSGFAPARQYGKPVRSISTLPVTFHITGSSSGKVPPYPVRPISHGPVQPQMAAPAGSQVVQKLVSLQDSSYWLDKDRQVVHVYRYYFTYDRLGRPATHTQEYRDGGVLLSTLQLHYEYGPDGRLAAKASDRLRYTFHYGASGQLSGLTAATRAKQQWVAFEEVTLQENARQPDGTRVVSLLVSHVRAGVAENDVAGSYVVKADNSISQSTISRTNYQAVARPVELNFVHDAKINPLRELLMERWHRFDSESGPHNVVRVLVNGQVGRATTYTYNEAGYPTQGVSRKGNQLPFQTQTFTYADIVVPAPITADSAAGVAIYPNPAASATVVKAPQIHRGPATLRLFNAATGELRQQTEHTVSSTFETTISVAGLEKGVYIVEVSNGAVVVKGRLVVD